MNAPSQWEADAQFVEAANAFRGFFAELREAFVERETLFTQLELALLCREHVLIIGPPGTAKSAIAHAVLGRIVDEESGRPSLFSKQLAENTVQTDLIGPVDFKVLTETGRTEHLTDEGMLGSVHAFLDEVFDGRDMLLRSILNVLHERELKHGRRITSGRCECAVMTSNRYLSEVLQRSPETLQAFADRISFICFTPKSFARRSSRGQMLHRSSHQQRPALSARLTLQALDTLQQAVEAVEVPPLVTEALESLADSLERELLAQVSRLPDYVPTKYFSQRSMVKALWALKAVVVRDRLYRRADRRLVAELEDLAQLEHFFLMGGPVEGELEALLKASADPRERAQLEILKTEHRTFAQALAKLSPSMAQSVEREATELKIVELTQVAATRLEAWVASVAATTARTLRDALAPGPRHPENRAALVQAASALVRALEARVSIGLAGQGEGRSGSALLQSFRETLELARKVPELSERVPALASRVSSFGQQSGEMAALAAEGTEFDDSLRLDALSALAASLTEELQALSELLQAAATLTPEVSRATVTAVRDRAALALRRRAVRAFEQPTDGKGQTPLETLVVGAKRLAAFERALTALSANQTGFRASLLDPLAARYVSDLVALPAQTLESLWRNLELARENLEREGADANRAIASAAPHLHERVIALTQASRQEALPAAPVIKPLAPDTSTTYRNLVAKLGLAGTLDAVAGLDALLARAGERRLPASVTAELGLVELNRVSARVGFLSAWWSGLVEALPKGEGSASERAFESLVKSRFPQLITREGEWVRLEAALRRLHDGHPEQRQTIEELLEEIAEGRTSFERVTRQIIEGRARR